MFSTAFEGRGWPPMVAESGNRVVGIYPDPAAVHYTFRKNDDLPSDVTNRRTDFPVQVACEQKSFFEWFVLAQVRTASKRSQPQPCVSHELLVRGD